MEVLLISLSSFLVSVALSKVDRLRTGMSGCINYGTCNFFFCRENTKSWMRRLLKRHGGRRYGRLGVRWYLMWRVPVSSAVTSSPECTAAWHCCVAPILQRSQSRAHQMALESEAQRGRKGRRTKRSGGTKGERLKWCEMGLETSLTKSRGRQSTKGGKRLQEKSKSYFPRQMVKSQKNVIVKTNLSLARLVWQSQ